jgi:hypothetical protein
MPKPNDSNEALKLKERLRKKRNAMENEKLLQQLKDNKEAKAAAVAAAEAAENKEYENVGEAVYEDNPSIVFDETDDLIPVGEEDEAEGGSRHRRMRRKTSRKTRRKTHRKRGKKYTMRGGGKWDEDYERKRNRMLEIERAKRKERERNAASADVEPDVEPDVGDPDVVVGEDVYLDTDGGSRRIKRGKKYRKRTYKRGK